LIIRPGFVVGPHDYSDRFTSWVRRVRQGGEMLAPGAPAVPLQFIDGRDLAAFTLRRVEARRAATYNVTGPAEPFTWGDLFARSKRWLGVDTRCTWVSDAFLEAHDLANWKLPLWVPPTDRGLMACDCRRAMAAGLTFRPFEETVADTLQWHDAFGVASAQLAPERETALLRAWHGG
jgi:2'-hydroxyisoflavone reductase